MKNYVDNRNMMKSLKSEILAKRMLIALAAVFSLCCLKLCADDMVISPAQAQVERDNFVTEAKKYVGAPYVYGAVGPESFDCSGLIYFVAREATGKQLPRTAKAIYNYCRIIPDKNKEVGDLLFFKTTGTDTISHVGIYIGNGQFISAISDGPNTGVIISSINQDYWKGKYVAAGQFLKSGKAEEVVVEEKYVPEEEPKVEEKKTKKVETKKETQPETKPKSKTNVVAINSNEKKPAAEGTFGKKLHDNLVLDASVYCDWSLISPNSFMISWRGIDVQTNCYYSAWSLRPGIGLVFRFNYGLKMFQIPVLFSSTLNDYLRIYAGPVISFSHGTLLKTDKEVKGSVFPGIIGASVTTPAFKAGPTFIQFVQDISYTTFNNEDNSALSPLESISAGFVLYTGMKFTVPAKNF